MTRCFNVYSRRTPIYDRRFKISDFFQFSNRCSNDRRSIFEGGLPPEPKRQGWKRLCGEAKAVFFVPAARARSARDRGAGFTKTGLSQAVFKRTARPAPREWRQAGGRSVVPKRLPMRRRRHERERRGALKKQKSLFRLCRFFCLILFTPDGRNMHVYDGLPLCPPQGPNHRNPLREYA